MSHTSDWRQEPAAIVEDALELSKHGNTLPTIEELEEIAAGYRVHVAYLPADQLPTALTCHRKRLIIIPNNRNPDRKRDMLLHELFEVLLRLPVAEEYHHPNTGSDEYHNVACLGVKRAHARMMEQKQQQIRVRKRERAQTLRRKQNLERKLQQIQEQIARADERLQQFDAELE